MASPGKHVEAQRESAAASRQAVEAVLAELVAGSRPEEIAREPSFGWRPIACDAARRDVERLTPLAEQALVSKQAFAQHQTAADVAEGEVARATEELALLTAGTRREQIAAQVRADQLPTLTSDALIDAGTNTPLAPGSSIPGGFWSPISDRSLDLRFRVTQRFFDLASLRRGQAASADVVAARESYHAATDQAARGGALAYVQVLKARATRWVSTWAPRWS